MIYYRFFIRGAASAVFTAVNVCIIWLGVASPTCMLSYVLMDNRPLYRYCCSLAHAVTCALGGTQISPRKSFEDRWRGIFNKPDDLPDCQTAASEKWRHCWCCYLYGDNCVTWAGRSQLYAITPEWLRVCVAMLLLTSSCYTKNYISLMDENAQRSGYRWSYETNGGAVCGAFWGAADWTGTLAFHGFRHLEAHLFSVRLQLGVLDYWLRDVALFLL